LPKVLFGRKRRGGKGLSGGIKLPQSEGTKLVGTGGALELYGGKKVGGKFGGMKKLRKGGKSLPKGRTEKNRVGRGTGIRLKGWRKGPRKDRGKRKGSGV